MFPLLLAQGSPDVAALVVCRTTMPLSPTGLDARKALQALVDGDLKGFSDADGAVADHSRPGDDRHIAVDEETVAYPSAQFAGSACAAGHGQRNGCPDARYAAAASAAIIQKDSCSRLLDKRQSLI